MLANNAEPIKLTVYVTPFVLLSLWIYGLYAQALINKSRFIARIASERIAEGDFGSAIAMLLEVIPDRQRSPLDERRYRPYSDEADAALNAAVSNFKSVQRLKGHTGLVQNVQFSSDGQHALTASDDGTVLFWNLGAKPTAHPIVSHDSSIPFGDLVNDATLSSDNQFIAVAQMGLAPRIWKAATGELVSSLDREDGKVWSIKFSPDNKRVVTGSDDGAVRVWNPATGEMIAELAERGESVYFVTFSNDGQRIATASKDGIGRVYDAHDGSISFELKGHTDVLRWVTFSADNKLIATASDDRSARIWDATTGHQVGILDGHKDRVQRVAFSHDGRRIMTASWDGRVRFWTWPDMNLWKVPEQWHTDSINSAMYSPDGRLVLSLSADRTARLWDSETGEVVGTVLGAPDVLIAGAFSPDGRKILIAGGSGYLSILSVDPASLITTFVGHRDYVRTATFSKDGSEVMSADDKSVVVWNVKTKKEVFHFLPGGNTVVGASYSHDGALILTSSFHAAQLWNARTGELIRTFDKHWSSDVMARLSPDDHSIATIGLNTIELWDTQTGANLKELGGPDDILPEIKYFAFSNDSQALVAGTENGAYLWDLNNPKPEVLGDADAEESVTVVAISHDGKKVALGELSGQVRGWDRASKRAYFSTGELVDGYVSVMQFTPDDKDLVVGFDTGDVKVLSAETGKVIFGFRGHKDKVSAIAVAKDSGTLVTASKDQTIKLWSLKSGLLLTTLVGHGDEVNSIDLCCDDNLLVSGSSDKTVRVWRLFRDLQALIVEARALPFEKLDPSEKRLVFRR